MQKHIFTIKEYLEVLYNADLLVDPMSISTTDYNTMVANLTYDSRKSSPGTLFVCKGQHFRSVYLNDAIRQGAFAYVCEDKPQGADESAICIQVKDIRAAMVVLAKKYYGDISGKIKLIGITGTKGKSTTSYFLRSILDDYLSETIGKRVAISSSIHTYDGITEQISAITTPEIFDLYELICNAIESGISHMIVEVSSQALKYNRIAGLTFEEAVFLNIGEDHISPIEHPDFKDYFYSKLKIFDIARNAIINKDSDYYDFIEEAAEKVGQLHTFSATDKSANVFAYNIDSNDGRPNFEVCITGMHDYSVAKGQLNLAAYGTINVENALAAIAIASDLGVPFSFIQSGLSKAVVPGRMEVFNRSDGCTIIVDYAHNKLSFEQLFKNVKKDFPNRKIIVVFGAVGGKAYDRRKEVGSVVGQNADYAIITERLSGEENVNDICSEIALYVEENDCDYEIITDRVRAIKTALNLADSDTLVILAGKGRERVEKHGSELIATPSDVDLVLELI